MDRESACLLGKDHGGGAEEARRPQVGTGGGMGRHGHRRGMRPLRVGQGSNGATEDREACQDTRCKVKSKSKRENAWQLAFPGELFGART